MSFFVPDTTTSVVPPTLSDLASLVESLLTSAGIIFGAAWGYLKFIRGRVFKERLDLEANAVLLTAAERNFGQVSIRVANVGLSRVLLQRTGSAVVVHSLQSNHPSSARALGSSLWTEIGAFPVELREMWLEPGEIWRDQQLFLVPQGTESALFEVTIGSRNHLWTARAVASPAQPKEQANG